MWFFIELLQHNSYIKAANSWYTHSICRLISILLMGGLLLTDLHLRSEHKSYELRLMARQVGRRTYL